MSEPEGPRRISTRLARRDNNFDLLRLAAAAIVLVFHSFPLAGRPQPLVPFTDLPASVVGLLIFFAMSGFLVAASWAREPRVGPFAVKRALRIFPGLLVALILTAYVIGPLASTVGPVDYLTRGAPAKYVGGQSLLLTSQGIHGRLIDHVTELPEGSLPGVFDDNPVDAVNGSLWTLPVEVTAYALLVVAGLGWLFRRRRRAGVAGLALAVAAGAFALRAGGTETYELYGVFAGGALLYLLRDRLDLDTRVFVAALVAWVASYQLPDLAQAAVTGLTLPYAVVFLAFRGLDALRRLTRPGDVSYGIYIYAYPIQQLVVATTGTRSAALLIALSGVATYLVALVSWRVIERPALGLKRHLGRGRRRGVPPAVRAASP